MRSHGHCSPRQHGVSEAGPWHEAGSACRTTASAGSDRGRQRILIEWSAILRLSAPWLRRSGCLRVSRCGYEGGITTSSDVHDVGAGGPGRVRVSRISPAPRLPGGVLLIRDVVAPVGARFAGRGLVHGQVGHEGVGSGTMPVLLPRGCVHRLAGVDQPASCGAATASSQTSPVNHSGGFLTVGRLGSTRIGFLFFLAWAPR